jgi:hypothetical protein
MALAHSTLGPISTITRISKFLVVNGNKHLPSQQGVCLPEAEAGDSSTTARTDMVMQLQGRQQQVRN